MTPSERLESLFIKYLQRRCEPGEVEELAGLLQQADAEKALDGPMKALWTQIRDQQVEYPVDWDKMYETVSNTEEDLLTLNRRRHNKVRRIGYRMAAACILLLIAAITYWGIMGRTRPYPGGAAIAMIPTDTGQPPANKKQVIHLPDGSTVILNSNSKLDYPMNFTGATREVYLSGEAFFDIAPHPGHPFLVHTGKLTTRVLGTSFNIRAYPNDGAVEVTVAHGKVQVLEEGKSMGLLTDDQQLRFSSGTGKFVQRKVDIQPVIAWKPNEISFDDITMEDAVKRIATRFHLGLTFVNPVLKDCRVTATFYDDDGLNEIMTVICGVSQSEFTIQNNTIIIDGKGCN
jgi:ferric-dicitrate binding protein FerR (iron transport regulator)